MNDTVIGTNARIERVIVDKNVHVGEGAEVGYGMDNVPNRQFPDRLNTGLTAIGKYARVPGAVKIGHNVIISAGAQEDDFNSDFVSSGETI
jgi:glucose-1-phosphate adenylyltransferase